MRNFSVVLPIYNEQDNLHLIYEETINAFKKIKNSNFEIIFVNDGSTDNSNKILLEIRRKNPKRVKIINLIKNFGQTAALQAGFDNCKGQIIVTLDGDGQNDPKDLSKMIDKLNQGYDLVCGWRKKRKDPLSKKIPSYFANKIIKLVTKVNINDFGCTFKIFKKQFLEKINIYGEMHRFIPVYFFWAGAKISEIEVSHKERIYGKSKYGISRTFKVILDLIVVQFLLKYKTKPIYFFGFTSFLFFFIALLCFSYASYLKIIYNTSFISTPLPLLTVMLFVMGLITILLGLVAELLTRVQFEVNKDKPYIIKK